MEERHFDNLTKALARPLGRRAAIKSLAAAVFGSMAPLAGAEAATAGSNSACDIWCHANFSGSAAGSCTSSAAKRRGPCYQCGPASPNGGQGQAVCNGKCASVTTTANCGACGHACACPAHGTATCDGGQCGVTCDAGYCASGGACYRAGTVNPANHCQTCHPGQGAAGWVTRTCAAGDQCHGAGQCDPATGQCANPDLADGTPCNDSNSCTGGDACQAGVCTGGAAVACAPAGVCYTATCDPVKGCQNTPKPAGTPCSDSNSCTIGDACDGNGTCVPGQQLACPPCHACDQASGTCVADPAQAGHACPGNGNLCFGAFTCDQGGNCAGAQPVACAPLDGCHVAGTCDPATGLCSNPNGPDGTTCVDGNLCNTCQAGVCTPVTCDSGDPCTVGTCDPNNGCVHTPKDCSDGLVCTDDICDSATGECRHVVNLANCGPLSSCQTASCGDGRDCLITNNDELCPTHPKAPACLLPLCTDTGACSYLDICGASHPDCGGSASCTCNSTLNKCVKTVPT